MLHAHGAHGSLKGSVACLFDPEYVFSFLRRNPGRLNGPRPAPSTLPDNSADAFQETVETFPGLEAVDAGSLERATDGVPLVTLCTNATEPFFHASMAAAGTHINAIGAIVPGRVEFTEDVFPRCARIAVDTLDGVKELSREFMDYFGAGRESWEKVVPISAIMGESLHRPEDADLTLFKAMGMGLADLVVAIEILKRNYGAEGAHRLPGRVRMQLPLG